MTNLNPIQNLSTGPRTEAGKEASAKNAIKHGACSLSTLILPTESLEDFVQLEKNWFIHYGINPNEPKTQHETGLIKAAVRADWLSQRAERLYVELEARYFAETPDPTTWTEDQHRNLTRLLRYRTANANLFAKARKAVEDCWRNRVIEAARHQTMRHKEVKLAIYQEKNKSPLGYEEEIGQIKAALKASPPRS